MLDVDGEALAAEALFAAVVAGEEESLVLLEVGHGNSDVARGGVGGVLGRLVRSCHGRSLLHRRRPYDTDDFSSFIDDERSTPTVSPSFSIFFVVYVVI